MAQGMAESHISASLEDFEHHERASPVLRPPSVRSGFLREGSNGPLGDSDSESDGPWSPSHGARANVAVAGGGWYRHQPYLQSSVLQRRSSERSSVFRGPGSGRGLSSASGVGDELDPTLIPANIPLPRGSTSPVRDVPHSPSEVSALGFSEPGASALSRESNPKPSPGEGSYIRVAFRAEMQHRATLLEGLADKFWQQVQRSSLSLRGVVAMLGACMLFALLMREPTGLAGPTPDLIKLSGLARSMEPLMYYSSRGVQYNTELQETGVAVWDLGESIRVNNMTGAGPLCQELDELLEILSKLRDTLLKYLFSVDGDMDNVLLTMDWARRELAAVNGTPEPSGLSLAAANMHELLSRVGWLESGDGGGAPTAAGRMVTLVFGRTRAQRTRSTLQRTFDEVLTVLETIVDDQLSQAMELFAYFQRIDEHFQNLQSITVRELGEQERAQDELLSHLWHRAMGTNAYRLRKFERNRITLEALRSRTTYNKNLLVDHEGKVRALQGGLEDLRHRLVSPLLRDGYASSTASLEDQIRGIEDSHRYLNAIRQTQKKRVFEEIFGAYSRARHLLIDPKHPKNAIEGPEN